MKHVVIAMVIICIIDMVGFSSSVSGGEIRKYQTPEKINAIISAKPQEQIFLALESIWREIFKRAGINNFFLEHYPSKRATRMLVDGHDNANIDIWRVDNYDEILLKNGDIKKIGDIVKIEPHTNRNLHLAFALKSRNFHITSINDLAGKNLRAEHLLGYVWDMTIIEKVFPPQSISSVSYREQAFSRLKFNRTDVFVGPKSLIVELNKHQESGKFTEIESIGDIGYAYAHAWVSKPFASKYPELISSLSPIITKMVEDGTIAKMMKDNTLDWEY